jgi:hypothetical protein
MANAVLLNAAIVLAVVATALVLWLPRVRCSMTWRAMTTPLASIIGSGFLVLGPILNDAYGKYAPVAMSALCLVGYLFGAAVRFNIRALDGGQGGKGSTDAILEDIASWALSFAYIISVAYYLNLFGAFGVRLTPFNDPTNARLLTTAIYGAIALAGWMGGFKMLERLEYASVSAKLAVIGGLFVGLFAYFVGRASDDALVANAAKLEGYAALTLGFGLIVTVQGFETSRYLAAEYDGATRITSMKWAQWVSSAIYMFYILLLAYVFPSGDFKLTETAVVDLMGMVAPVLPFLLVIAALAAQFSAAVADTSGSGGLAAELTGNRISPRAGYLALVLIGIGLTWSANVFEIIAYASRAFALYYAIQSALASLRAWRSGMHRELAAGYAALAALGSAIVIFGQAVDV